MSTRTARAREIVEELRSAKPSSPGVQIAEALLAAGRGDDELAHKTLEGVLSAEPELRAALSHDPDLGRLLPRPRG